MELKVTYAAPPNVDIEITPGAGYAGPHNVDWGDGTREQLAGGDTTASHAYPGDGFYKLNVSSGGHGSSTRTVILQNQPAAAAAGAHAREREKLAEEQFALSGMTTKLG